MFTHTVSLDPSDNSGGKGTADHSLIPHSQRKGKRGMLKVVSNQRNRNLNDEASTGNY